MDAAIPHLRQYERQIDWQTRIADVGTEVEELPKVSQYTISVTS